jgi:hypothetical protein
MTRKERKAPAPASVGASKSDPIPRMTAVGVKIVGGIDPPYRSQHLC